MTIRVRNLFRCLGVPSTQSRVLPALIAGLGMILSGRATAQTFTTLYRFSAINYDTAVNAFTNSDGAYPYAGLVLSGGILYGTTQSAGGSGNGTVFALNTNGSGFTNLHSFTALSNNQTNNDGARPYAGLIFSSNTLYGTTVEGGATGAGTVFALNTNGMGFTNLHSFIFGSDGGNPVAGLVLSGNTLYGMTQSGGASGDGTLFAVNINGMGFTNLHTFTGGSDGGVSYGGLILSGNTLYGTTEIGGSSLDGTVFAFNTNNGVLSTVHSFTSTEDSTNSDGANPEAGLIISGNTLFGTALNGGSSDAGTVFDVNTNDNLFTVLHTFTGNVTGDIDGADVQAGLILSGNTLYGTARIGGSLGAGTIFAVNTNGTGFTTLYNFSGGDDGSGPLAGLILSGNILYGTASGGGISPGYGTVFSLLLAPQVTIVLSGTNVILTWPTNATGYALQSTTNLVSPAVWATVSPGPLLVNGQNTVTNTVSGTQQFFRLATP